MNVGDLQATLNLETSGFRRGADDAVSAVGSMQRAFEVFTGVELAHVFELATEKIKDFVVESIKLAYQTTIVESAFKQMGEAAGVNTEALVEALSRAANGTVAVSSIVRTAARDLQQGLQPEQIVKIMELARSQSMLTGQTVAEGFASIGEAIANQQVRALKYMGVVINVQHAMDDFAFAHGRSAMALTEAGRAQAIMTAVLEVSRGKMLDTTTAAAQMKDSVEQAGARFENLKDQVGDMLIKAFFPLVGFLRDQTIPWLKQMALYAQSGLSSLMILVNAMMGTTAAAVAFFGSLIDDLEHKRLPSLSKAYIAAKEASALYQEQGENLKDAQAKLNEEIEKGQQPLEKTQKTLENMGNNTSGAQTFRTVRTEVAASTAAMTELNGKLRDLGSEADRDAAELDNLLKPFNTMLAEGKIPRALLDIAANIANVIVTTKRWNVDHDALIATALKGTADVNSAETALTGFRDARFDAYLRATQGELAAQLDAISRGAEAQKTATFSLILDAQDRRDAVRVINEKADLDRTRAIVVSTQTETDLLSSAWSFRLQRYVELLAAGTIGQDRFEELVRNGSIETTGKLIAEGQKRLDYEKTSQVQSLLLLAQTQQGSGDYFKFLGTSLAIAAAQSDTFYQGLTKVAQATFQDLTALASGFLFGFITGTLSAADAFKKFGLSLLKTITDFLAQQVVKEFLGLLLGGGTSGGGVLGGLAGSVLGGGSASGGGGGLLGSALTGLAGLAAKFGFPALSEFLKPAAAAGGAGLAVGTALGGEQFIPSLELTAGGSFSDSTSALGAADFLGKFHDGGVVSGDGLGLLQGGETVLTPSMASRIAEAFGTSTAIASGAASIAALALSLSGNRDAAVAGQILSVGAGLIPAAVPIISGALAAGAAGAGAAAASLGVGAAAGGAGAIVAIPGLLGMLFGKGGFFGGRGENPLSPAEKFALDSPNIIDYRAHAFDLLAGRASPAELAYALQSPFHFNQVATSFALNPGDNLPVAFDPSSPQTQPAGRFDAASSLLVASEGESMFEGFVRNQHRGAFVSDAVPSFGEGGVVTEPMLALVGERPEAIIPLDALGGGGGARTVIVKVVVDGRELGEAVIKDLDSQVLGGRKFSWGQNIVARNRS